MHTQTGRPSAGFKTKAPRQSDHRNGEERKDIPIAQSVIDRLFPAHFQAGFGARYVKLAGEREAQQGPKTKTEPPPGQRFAHESFDCHSWRFWILFLDINKSQV